MTQSTKDHLEIPRPRRPVMPRSTEPSPQGASAGSSPAHRFAVDVDRPKRIDHFIDYFGTGDAPSGPSRLDADGVR
jgi:hypothetical protein